MEDKKVSAIIVAGGSGKRLNSGTPKQFLFLDNKPIIMYTISKFQECDFINEIIVVLNRDYIKYFEELIKDYNINKIKIVRGGKERTNSVLNGLKAVSDESKIVLIHDAVRPFVTHDMIVEVLLKTIQYGACIPGVKAKDTLKTCSNNFVKNTLDRNNIYNIQTPQGFSKDKLLSVFSNLEDDEVFTDEATLFEVKGYDVYITEGDYYNIKITTKEDLVFAEAILKSTK